jgi:hypothetical protein
MIKERSFAIMNFGLFLEGKSPKQTLNLYAKVKSNLELRIPEIAL